MRKVHKSEKQIASTQALADLRSAGLPSSSLDGGHEVSLVSGSNDSVCLQRRGGAYFRIYRNW